MPRSTPSSRPTPATARNADPSLSSSMTTQWSITSVAATTDATSLRQRVEVLLAEREPPQPRDGGLLGGLPAQPVMRALLRGDVADQAVEERLTALTVEAQRVDRRPDDLAVRQHVALDERLRVPILPEPALDDSPARTDILRMRDLRRGVPQQLLARSREKATEGVVDLEPTPVGAHNRHPDGDVGEATRQAVDIPPARGDDAPHDRARPCDHAEQPRLHTNQDSRIGPEVGVTGRCVVGSVTSPRAGAVTRAGVAPRSDRAGTTRNSPRLVRRGDRWLGRGIVRRARVRPVPSSRVHRSGSVDKASCREVVIAPLRKQEDHAAPRHAPRPSCLRRTVSPAATTSRAPDRVRRRRQ